MKFIRYWLKIPNLKNNFLSLQGNNNYTMAIKKKSKANKVCQKKMSKDNLFED